MKKSFYLLTISLAVLFASCKKNYTCTCTKVIYGISSDTTVNLPKYTKKSARKDCNDVETSIQMQLATSASASVKCSI